MHGDVSGDGLILLTDTENPVSALLLRLQFTLKGVASFSWPLRVNLGYASRIVPGWRTSLCIKYAHGTRRLSIYANALWELATKKQLIFYEGWWAVFTQSFSSFLCASAVVCLWSFKSETQSKSKEKAFIIMQQSPACLIHHTHPWSLAAPTKGLFTWMN